MRRRALAPRTPRRSILTASVLALVLASGLAPLRPAVPASAGTAETMEASIVRWINAARTQAGLGTLRVDRRLTGLAGDRVAVLASKDQLSHDTPGCLSCQLSDRGVAYDLFGEVQATNSYPWGSQSARVVFESWRGSASHLDILLDPDLDSIGVGVALRSANGVTYATALLVDAPAVAATSRSRPLPTPRPKAAAAPRPTARPTPAPRPEPSTTIGPFSETRLIPL